MVCYFNCFVVFWIQTQFSVFLCRRWMLWSVRFSCWRICVMKELFSTTVVFGTSNKKNSPYLLSLCLGYVYYIWIYLIYQLNPYWSHLPKKKQFWTVTTVNKHVFSGWCLQTRSAYEIIFSQNECLNEPLSPVDPVPEPVFNISWAVLFLGSIECVSHTLSGNWKCLCFTGVGAGRAERWQGQVSVWLFGMASLLWPEVFCWQLKVKSVSQSDPASQVLVDQVFCAAIPLWETLNIEGVWSHAHCMFIYLVFVLKTWLRCCFPEKQNDSTSAGASIFLFHYLYESCYLHHTHYSEADFL